MHALTSTALLQRTSVASQPPLSERPFDLLLVVSYVVFFLIAVLVDIAQALAGPFPTREDVAGKVWQLSITAESATGDR